MSARSWNDHESRIKSLEEFVDAASANTSRAIVVRQDFSKGAGYQTSYVMTDNENGSFSGGTFDPANIITARDGVVTTPDGKALYSSSFAGIKANRIKVDSIDPDGTIHLNAAPHSSYTEDVRIHVYYTVPLGVSLIGYVSEDILTEPETDDLSVAQDVALQDTGGNYASSDIEGALAEVAAVANPTTKVGNFNYIDHIPQSPEPSYLEGRIYYDDTVKALTVMNDESVPRHNVGRELWPTKVINITGSLIPDGTAVYVNGTSGGYPSVAPAQADNITTAQVYGVVTHDIPDTQTGECTTSGIVRNFDTSGFNPGDTLYLSDDTPGAVTNKQQPTVVYVGMALDSSATGNLLVSPARYVLARNVVRVRLKSDLPDPVGGVITLADETTYIFMDIINLGTDRLVGGEGTSLVGSSRDFHGFNYTGTGNAITFANKDFTMVNITIDSPNGTAFDISGTNTEYGTIFYCKFENNDQIGNVSGMYIFKFIGNLVRDTTTNGITSSGTGSHFYFLDNDVINVAGNSIDMGTSTWGALIMFSRNHFHTAGAGQTVFAGTPSFTVGGGQMVTNNIIGPGTYIDAGSTIVNSNINWNFIANVGLNDSQRVGQMYMNNNSTSTALTANTPTKVLGTTTADQLERFDTNGVSNRLRYIGLQTIRFKVSCSFTLEAGSGDIIEVTIYKNGNLIDGAFNKVEVGGFLSADRAAGMVHGIVELATNDYVELWIENQTDGTDATVTNMSFNIHGVA